MMSGGLDSRLTGLGLSPVRVIVFCYCVSNELTSHNDSLSGNVNSY